MMFDAKEIEKVVLGLLGGSVDAVGDAAFDYGVKERVEVLTEVMKNLHQRIYELSKKCEFNKRFKSLKDIGEVCDDYLRYVSE